MASNPKQPLSNYFDRDIVKGNRSNFNVGYKNRFSMDFGYLIPAGLWDIPADSHFECDLESVISSNPTLAPVLGKMKFRAEAYFVEKAAYVQKLRDNDKVPIDRNVPFPTFSAQSNQRYYSAKGSITDFLQMYPAGWSSYFINGQDPNDATPPLNAIPFIMYYDIYRNYYCNPQDDNIPIRDLGYHVPTAPPEYPEDFTYHPIRDVFVTREDLDDFVRNARDSQAVDLVFSNHLGITAFSGRSIDSIYYKVTPLQHALGSHHGLMRRTLNNDFFTSFVSNDNVALMKKYSTLYTQNDGYGNAIQMEQIVMANRNWRLATRSLLWGTDWKDFNKVHYGVDLLIPYGKPQFLGAISSDVIFNDVISQAQTGDNSGENASDVTSNRNLGSRSGLAFGALRNDKKKFIEFNTKDEGYVMVLLSIVPEVDYFQGIDPMYFKTNLQHSWMQEYNSIGMQDFHQTWACAVPYDNLSGTTPWPSMNTALWKVPIWFEYMAKYNQLHGDFTADFMNRYWVFSRPFTSLNTLFGNGVFNDPTDIDYADTEMNFSTYVLPEMYNYIFANVAGQDNFQVQVRFDARLNCMLDKQVISYL